MTVSAFKHATREEWLQAGVAELDRRVFAPAGFPLPDVRVSIGFPSRGALSRRARALGQCFSRSAADDRRAAIFISPVLADPGEMIGVLAHECVHAQMDNRGGHGAEFRKVARTIGLTAGKPTTAGPGPELAEIVGEIAAALGPLAHAALRPVSLDAKSGTRMVKIACGACGYTARTTRRWLAVGLPTCCCGSPMRLAEGGRP